MIKLLAWCSKVSKKTTYQFSQNQIPQVSLPEVRTIINIFEMLADDLSDTWSFYGKICEFIESEYGSLRQEWKFYGKKSGWILKLINVKRNVMFVVPLLNYFRVAFTFGEKATELVLKSNLPERIKEDLAEARKYAEGRTIQLEVNNEDDLNSVIELIKIKLQP